MSLQIRGDNLLLVEGRDEINLFKALIERCLDDEVNIQVIDAGGVDQFPPEVSSNSHCDPSASDAPVNRRRA